MTRPRFEELDYCSTPLGELILRRRAVLSLGGVEVFEVRLDGRFLMSSLVNFSEIALANIALEAHAAPECDVLIGGLGLGYTAKAALDCARVQSVTVVEYLRPVIRWHESRLVPLAAAICADPRCTLIHGDFFHFIGATCGRPPGDADEPDPVAALAPAEGYDLILVDIDHSPRGVLRSCHADFYTADGLQAVALRLRPGGVFALWSADPPDESFLNDVRTVFASAEVHAERFYHPLMNEADVNYIITARVA